MATQTKNGARPCLASQIDRLDGILEGLSEALAGSVGEAVGQGMAGLRQPLQQAARDAVRQALADSTLWPAMIPLKGVPVAQSQPGAAPGAGPLVRLASWLEGGLTSAAVRGGLWLQAGWTRAGKSGRELLSWLGRAWRALLALLPLAWVLRWHILVAAASGLALGVFSLLAGPAVAVVLSLLGGFALVLLALVVANLWFAHLKGPTAEARPASVFPINGGLP